MKNPIVTRSFHRSWAGSACFVLAMLLSLFFVAPVQAGWGPIGTGMNAKVEALLTDGVYVYAGGSFTRADGQVTKYIARWTGAFGWQALGGGMNGPVKALIKFNGQVHAAGDFTLAGNTSCKGIARWDGTQWHALGSGVNGTIHALAVHGTSLYVGGVFTQAGGNTARNVARWTGQSWKRLGSGTNGAVRAIASYNGDVYVGGTFTSAGGATASRLARWRTGQWEPIVASGSPVEGVSGPVYALFPSAGRLYVGGSFANAGETSANNLAIWTGVSWNAAGVGTNGPVMCLFVIYSSGFNLVLAGGAFTEAGGEVAHRFARYFDSTPSFWQGDNGLGSTGTNGTVLAVSFWDIGGSFTTADGENTSRIATGHP